MQSRRLRLSAADISLRRENRGTVPTQAEEYS